MLFLSWIWLLYPTSLVVRWRIIATLFMQLGPCMMSALYLHWLEFIDLYICISFKLMSVILFWTA